MFTALRRGAGMCALLLVEAVALVALARVGRRPAFAVPWDHLGEWLDRAPPFDVLVALGRGVALVGVAWVTATTALYALASAARLPSAATRALRWSTVPAVRRVVDAAFVASVVSVGVAAPLGSVARAADAPSVSVVVRDGRAVGGAAPSPRLGSVPSPPVVPPFTNAVVTVDVGDSLWEVAARAVADATGRTRDAVPDAEVAPYWQSVCDTNAPRLGSGDVDLVHPGDVIELPPYS